MRKQPFQTLAGAVDVPLMQQQGSFGYAESDGLQVLEMPYKGGVSMMVLLPRKADGLPALESSLTQAKLNDCLKSLRSRRVDVTLPRFRADSRFSLVKELKRLGMVDAFSQKDANFSGVTDQEEIFVKDVIHQGVIDVNEEGTEAAAATAVVSEKKDAAPEPPVQFRADHPFVFLIRDLNTQTILFLGRLTNPTAD